MDRRHARHRRRERLTARRPLRFEPGSASSDRPACLGAGDDLGDRPTERRGGARGVVELDLDAVVGDLDADRVTVDLDGRHRPPLRPADERRRRARRACPVRSTSTPRRRAGVGRIAEHAHGVRRPALLHHDRREPRVVGAGGEQRGHRDRRGPRRSRRRRWPRAGPPASRLVVRRAAGASASPITTCTTLARSGDVGGARAVADGLDRHRRRRTEPARQRRHQTPHRSGWSPRGWSPARRSAPPASRSRATVAGAGLGISPWALRTVPVPTATGLHRISSMPSDSSARTGTDHVDDRVERTHFVQLDVGRDRCRGWRLRPRPAGRTPPAPAPAPGRGGRPRRAVRRSPAPADGARARVRPCVIVS